jgi:hypothetical protein
MVDVIDTAQLETDRKAVRDHNPVAVVFGDLTVQCRKHTLIDTEVAAAAGALEGYQFSVYCVTSDWTTMPTVGDLLTIATVQYRILRIYKGIKSVRFDIGEKYTPRAK